MGGGRGGGQGKQEVPRTPTLLSCEGAFSDVVDSLVHENLFRGKPPDSKLLR